MCSQKILKHTEHGYVTECGHCGSIQVAFVTTILTLSHAQYYNYLQTVDELYSRHDQYMFRDEKIIQIPTPARSVTLVYSVNEVHRLLQLLIAGRNKLEHEKLFVFNNN